MTLTLTLFLLGGTCAVAGALLERDGRPGWAWAWSAVLAGTALLRLSGDLPEAGPLSSFLVALFPLLLLRAAHQFCGRAPPAWIPFAAIGLGGVRAVLRVAEPGPSEVAVALVPEACLVALAAWVAHGAPPSTRALVGARWIVPGLLACTGMKLYGPIVRLLGGDVPLAAWMAVGLPVACNQFMVSIAGAHEARDRALRASEQRFRQLAEGSRDTIAEVDADGRITYVSPNVRALLGLEPVDFVGRQLADVLAGLEARWPDAVVDETRDSDALVARSLAGTVYRIRDGEGAWHWFSTRASSYRAADGGLRSLAVSRDVTEQILDQEQRRQLEAQLHQAQKLKSLGVLAGGIAHDFNNLLMGILGNADLALEEAGASPKLRELLDDIVVSSERASQLTKQLMAYAGGARHTASPVELSSLLRDVAQRARAGAPKTAGLSIEAEEEIWVRGDPVQLQQVMMNLITNAGESFEERPGTVTLRTGVVWADRAYLAGCHPVDGLDAGEYAYFEVADDGAGIAPETLPGIFDPFFSTKFRGRGLGLAATLGIVRGHRGALRVRSAPGRGTTVRVLLPPAKACAREEDVVARNPRSRPGCTVLAVDDEPSVLRLVESMLASLGHTVLVASSGDQALRTYRERGADIDLVLLDLTMPKMSGDQVFRELRAIRPDLPIVLMSGHSELHAAECVSEAENVTFLAKPFRLASLSARLNVALAGGPPAPPPGGPRAAA